MNSSQIQYWSQHPEALNKETLYELRNLVIRYPYFQSARLLYLKNLYLLHDINFGAELRKAVLYVADRRTLFYLIEGATYQLQPKKGKQDALNIDIAEPGVDRTMSLIDAFLATIPEEQSTSDSCLTDYSMDYTVYLMNETDESQSVESSVLRGQELIDSFIEQSNSAVSQPSVSLEFVKNEETFGQVQENEIEFKEEVKSDAETNLDSTFFTETLAKIYVKQHRYDKALEIIKKLSLNYPKKNAYFADQIRFLEKLIINDKAK